MASRCRVHNEHDLGYVLDSNEFIILLCWPDNKQLIALSVVQFIASSPLASSLVLLALMFQFFVLACH